MNDDEHFNCTGTPTAHSAWVDREAAASPEASAQANRSPVSDRFPFEKVNIHAIRLRA
jgi:hypothetical protein